jgi:DNA phosphorothioation-dependent restriction protein DptG
MKNKWIFSSGTPQQCSKRILELFGFRFDNRLNGMTFTKNMIVSDVNGNRVKVFTDGKDINGNRLHIGRTAYPDEPCSSHTEWEDYIKSQTL